MENSLSGLVIALTIVALFSTSMVSYIALFPVEQGVTLSDSASRTAYAIMSNNTDAGTTATLTNLNNATASSFDQWDITTGFMGSNAIKQSQKTGISGYTSNIFAQLSVMALLVFGSGSPIVYALSVITLLALGYGTYTIIKFVRQGQ